MKKIKYFLLYIIAVIAFIIILPTGKKIIKTSKITNYQTTNIFALGDSLTEGVGDEQKNGGYVPYVVNSIKEINDNVEYKNYGKSGDKIGDIIKRINENKTLQNDLKKASIITLSVGGNDLMKVVKENILNLKKETFKKPMEDYKKELEKLYEIIRKYNEKAPIYHLGIYNPFYLTFSELTEMQEIVDEWNNITESIKEEKIYFIPINSEIYKGNGISNQTKNDLLSKDDSFHPNNTGYQIIAREFNRQIINTKEEWLVKE